MGRGSIDSMIITAPSSRCDPAEMPRKGTHAFSCAMLCKCACLMCSASGEAGRAGGQSGHRASALLLDRPCGTRQTDGAVRAPEGLYPRAAPAAQEAMTSRFCRCPWGLPPHLAHVVEPRYVACDFQLYDGSHQRYLLALRPPEGGALCRGGGPEAGNCTATHRAGQ